MTFEFWVVSDEFGKYGVLFPTATTKDLLQLRYALLPGFLSIATVAEAHWCCGIKSQLLYQANRIKHDFIGTPFQLLKLMMSMTQIYSIHVVSMIKHIEHIVKGTFTGN